MPPVLFPPNLVRTIQRHLQLPEPQPQRQLHVSESGVVAGPNGFISLKKLAEGVPAGQHRYRARNAHHEHLEPGDEALLLPPTVIARELCKFKNARVFKGDKRVPLRALGRYARVGKDVIYAAARGKRISNKSRLRLSLALRAIMAGTLTFKRSGRGLRFEPVRDK
jgi:hypothetical protein